jgi:hypothetical protein
VSSLALAPHKSSDVDVGALVLQFTGTKRAHDGTRVDQRVTGGTIEHTMTGASSLTITLDDTDRALTDSDLFTKQIDVKLDGLWWRLVKVSKSGDSLTLTFEDRAVSLLRKVTTPRKAARSKMTRAEFALSLVREIKTGGGIPFYCPDLHAKQKIATSTDKLTPAKRTATVSPGLAKSASLTIRGSKATSTQIANAERVLDVANSLSASPRAMLALMEAVIVESNVQNLPGGDADSRGILQVRDSTAGPMGINNRDVEQCCNAFLTRGFTGRGGAITLAAKYPSWTSGQIAQGVQGSAYPTRYDQAHAEAQAFIGSYTGGAPGGTLDATQIKKLPFQFQRGGTDGTKEDSWTCLQRLASEVQWACFMSDGTCYFVSEATLLKQKPRATLSEFDTGVDSIDFDVDNGKATSDATVTARVTRHGLPPGSVVVLEGVGPANGRWLVSDLTRGIFDAAATVTLKRATQPLPEPAAETTTVTTTSAGGASAFDALDAGTGGEVSGDVASAYAAAQAMNAKRYPYVWGGGHAHCGTPDRGTGKDPGIGFDCSGSTCAILAAAGMGYTLGGPADVSGTMAARWGEPGEGNGLTVWANSIHVWMEFKTSKGGQHFGTGDWGSATGTGGPAFQSRMHTKDGFTPRHWPGT